MNTWLRVGAKCVCINRTWELRTTGGPSLWRRLRLLFRRHPRFNEVVIIADVCAELCGSIGAIKLRGFGEVFYRANLFRPLVSLEDDVALFTSMRHGVDLSAEHIDELAR